MSEENKNETKNEAMLDPMKLMMGIAVDTAMSIARRLETIRSKYKANNIDVVPISEIDKIILR